jgi:hypothetical protein
MCCGGLGSGCEPNEFQPEFAKQWKRESNSGCCSNGADRNDCNKPSFAQAGSPLANWEAIYGKLVTRITYEKDVLTGHESQKIEKIACKNEVSRPSRHGCCSFSYRNVR